MPKLALFTLYLFAGLQLTAAMSDTNSQFFFATSNTANLDLSRWNTGIVVRWNWSLQMQKYFVIDQCNDDTHQESFIYKPGVLTDHQWIHPKSIEEIKT